WACRTTPRRVRQLVESICSKRSEQSKLFANASHKKHFACLPTALRPSGPVQQWIFHQAEKQFTTLPGPRYTSGYRTVRLKILSLLSLGVACNPGFLGLRLSAPD